MKNNNNQNDDTLKDLAEHGVREIIPEDEEYYTLNLRRDFDDCDDDFENGGVDVASIDPHNLYDMEEPPKSSSIYADGIVVKVSPDYRPQSTNQGGPVKEQHIVDEDTSGGYNVGDPGNVGIDEDTG